MYLFQVANQVLAKLEVLGALPASETSLVGVKRRRLEDSDSVSAKRRMLLQLTSTILPSMDGGRERGSVCRGRGRGRRG